jgi:16S rRNA (uracil1498-N3)-methyltransferase
VAKPRFFIDRPVRFSVTIAGDEAHHIRDVIRLQAGEVIEVVDSDGVVSDIEITGIEQGEIVGKVIARHSSRSDLADVYLFQALPKGGKIDDIIRQSTEIGVSGIYPIITERAIAKVNDEKAGKKLDRWQKIAVEAAKQSHRTSIPGINPVLSWREALEILQSFDLIILFWEEETRTLPYEVLATLKTHEIQETRETPESETAQFMEATSAPTVSKEPESSKTPLPNNPLANKKVAEKIAVIIGPEGGLSEKEAEDLKRIGAHAVTMGTSILRVETAAPVALALVIYDLRKMQHEKQRELLKRK